MCKRAAVPGDPDRVLVAYGTKHGATAEIAAAIAAAQRPGKVPSA